MAVIKHIILLLGTVCFIPAYLLAQRPEPPTLHSVTVDPETGFTTITWYPSPTPEFVDYYYVEQQDIGGTIRIISAPINPNNNSYVITSNDTQDGSVAYTVVAVNDLGGGDDLRSGWDRPDSTIFLDVEFDSCMATIGLSWNDYNNWRGNIDEYRIYRRLDAGIYDLQATINEGTNSFELGNLQANQTYELFVECFHKDGRSSKSNLIRVVSQMIAVPPFINADFATIGGGSSIDLSFTIGGTPGESFYRLLRSNSFEGPYSVIDSFGTDEVRIAYTDDVNFISAVYFYKLQVVNNCGVGATESNSANNIILSGSLSNLNAMLEWNEYRDWEGDVNEYRVIRTIGRQNPVTDTISSTVTTFFNDDINNLVSYIDPAEGLVCYSVVATENQNMYGISGRSESNQVCFSINPGVRIPNAFIPNDAEPANRSFEPVFSFLPEHYELIIYNRLGSKIWEGKEPWDGRVNGKYVPEGVYVYFLRVFNYSAEIKEYNGRVTVIYR